MIIFVPNCLFSLKLASLSAAPTNLVLNTPYKWLNGPCYSADPGKKPGEWRSNGYLCTCISTTVTDKLCVCDSKCVIRYIARPRKKRTCSLSLHRDQFTRFCDYCACL